MGSTIAKTLSNRIKIAKETNRLREGIFSRNLVSETQARPITSLNGDLSLHWKYGSFSNLDYETNNLQKRRIDCAVFENGQKILAADFLEFKSVSPQRDDNFFWDMDATGHHTCEIGMAYLSGWDSSELDNDVNFAVFEHLTTTPGSLKKCAPLLNKFIDDHVLKTAFVVITNPHPHDVANALNGDEDAKEDLQKLSFRRHMAKFRYWEDQMGFIKFGDEAKMNNWMYRLDPALGVEPEFHNFEISEIGGSIRCPELYEHEEKNQKMSM